MDIERNAPFDEERPGELEIETDFACVVSHREECTVSDPYVVVLLQTFGAWTLRAPQESSPKPGT